MPHEKSMVGRMFAADGQDMGDAKFWERDMSLTAENESAVLAEPMAAVEAAVRQVVYLARRNPDSRARLYAKLIEEYPEDARVEEWERETE